jgi:hypothetical protein
MAITTTPLGFQKPDGNELLRNGDNVIAANGQKAEDLIAADRSRISASEGRLAADEARISGVEARTTAAEGTLVTHDARLSALDVLGGLAPGSLTDATAAGVLSDPASLSHAALLAALAAAYPAVIAPAPSGGDDTAALNACLSGNPGATVFLRNGATYIITDALTVPTKTTFDLNGATLDARTIPAGTALSQRFAIRSDGALGMAAAISTALTQWTKTVTGISSTSGLAAGDMVLISNTEVVVPGMNLSTRVKGELNVISSVDSGTAVTLMLGMVLAYGTTGLTIRKVTPVENVTVRNGSILMGGVGSAHNGVQIQYGRNARIEGMSCDGAEDVGFGVKAMLGGKITRNTAINCTSSPTLGPTGYGACVWDGSRHVQVSSNYFENNRHHVAGGGIYPPMFVDVTDNHGRKSLSASYDCHEPCHYWKFKNNTAEGGTHGIFVRGQYITLEGNHVSDMSAEAYAVHAYNTVAEQWGIKIKNNTATHSGYGLSVGKASGETLEYVSRQLVVTGNDFTDCGTNPVRVRMFNVAKVGWNTVNGGLAAGMLLEGVDATTRSSNLTLDGNDVNLAGTHGVHIRYVDDVKGVGGQILSPGQNGYLVEQCNRVDIGPKVLNPTQIGIQFTGGTGHVLSNANVSGGTDGAYDALRSSLDGGTLNVVGGYFASARYAIYQTTTTTSKLNVTGSHVSDTVHATKVNDDAGTTYTFAGLL